MPLIKKYDKILIDFTYFFFFMNLTQNIDTSSRLESLENNINKEQTIIELFDAEQKLLDSIISKGYKYQIKKGWQTTDILPTQFKELDDDLKNITRKIQ